MVEPWNNIKKLLSSISATSFPLSLCHLFSGTTPPPQVLLFSVVHWAVTRQLPSLYCSFMPRSLHKTLKEYLKRELKLQLSIRWLNVAVTFTGPLCNLAGSDSGQLRVDGHRSVATIKGLLIRTRKRPMQRSEDGVSCPLSHGQIRDIVTCYSSCVAPLK